MAYFMQLNGVMFSNGTFFKPIRAYFTVSLLLYLAYLNPPFAIKGEKAVVG